MDPENFRISQILFKWIFLVYIELIHNPDYVQITFFFFYWPEILKKLFGPETDKISQFLGPETETFCQFLVQKVF